METFKWHHGPGSFLHKLSTEAIDIRYLYRNYFKKHVMVLFRFVFFFIFLYLQVFKLFISFLVIIFIHVFLITR